MRPVPIVHSRAFGTARILAPRAALGQPRPGPAMRAAAAELDEVRAQLVRVSSGRAALAAVIGPEKAALAEDEARAAVERAQTSYEDARAKGV
jgi:hypothetical protein